MNPTEENKAAQAKRIKSFAKKNCFEYKEANRFSVGVKILFSGVTEWIDLSAIDESHFLEVVISDVFQIGKECGISEIRKDFCKTLGL